MELTVQEFNDNCRYYGLLEDKQMGKQLKAEDFEWMSDFAKSEKRVPCSGRCCGYRISSAARLKEKTLCRYKIIAKSDMEYSDRPKIW